MPDFYTTIAEQPQEVLDTVVEAMEVRAAEPEMQEICRTYLGRAGVSPGQRVLEIGCGGGAATRLILANLAPAELVAVDPAAGLVAVARSVLADDPRATFRVGDALATGAADEEFDAVVAHTVFSHLTDPDGALVEAYRVLRPGGKLVVFDGDYATTTVALFEGDPLETTMSVVRRNMVHGPYVMRGLPAMTRRAGFCDISLMPHGYLQTAEPQYLLTLIGRAMDAAARGGEIGAELADGFKTEASRRVAEGRFYGAILFVSLVAVKPQD